jgi:hypothetical protein
MIVAVAIALAVSAIVLLVFSNVASKRPDKVNLGNRLFVMRQLAKRTAQAEDGPLFFNDLVRDQRPLPLAVILLGEDNWAAMNALPPGQPAKCVVGWDAARKVFVNPCTDDVYAPDGTRDDGGAPLSRYSATADGDSDRLIVDLNVSYADTLKTRPPS